MKVLDDNKYALFCDLCEQFQKEEGLSLEEARNECLRYLPASYKYYLKHLSGIEPNEKALKRMRKEVEAAKSA